MFFKLCQSVVVKTGKKSRTAIQGLDRNLPVFREVLFLQVRTVAVRGFKTAENGGMS